MSIYSNFLTKGFLTLLIFVNYLSISEGLECFSCQLSTCNRVRGIFNKANLSLGYNLIVRIPSFSCNISVVKVSSYHNYLALRTTGGYIINGNWDIVSSGRYIGAGTSFTYSHSSNPRKEETIYAVGPIRVPIDIMVIYQHSSYLNIQYEYWHPESEEMKSAAFRPMNSLISRTQSNNYQAYAQPKQSSHEKKIRNSFHENRKEESQSFNQFSWKIWKYTTCSKSCGGGKQELIYICTSSTGDVLEDTQCSSPRPKSQIISCNNKPCPPRWTLGEWSQCSVTCGTGHMVRSLYCIQNVEDSRTRLLPHDKCPLNTKPTHSDSLMQLCIMAPCTRWNVSEWRKCSLECGTGVRVRDVQCQADDINVSPEHCNEQEKPFAQELCQAHFCAKHTWFFTDWSKECVGGCEKGVHVRKVWCSPGMNSVEAHCPMNEEPSTTKPCNNFQICGAVWFTGPWSPCTSECGNGTRFREVVCVIRIHGTFRATINNECDLTSRPDEVDYCNTQTCPPQWYFTDWTECSRKCGRGRQRRAVQCLDSTHHASLDCPINQRPKTTRPCNTHPCKKHKYGKCTDKFKHCSMVERARLCKYSYYAKICCASCKQSRYPEIIYVKE